jgi:hypothetical protein
MALNIQNSNYNGEVLEQLLTLAATGNELVEKGLIRVEPNIGNKFSIPRLKSGSMLQKRKEMPTDSDSKGDFNYSERELKPEEFMAFTTFNPRSFERVWRKWQPKGPLVFAQLPAEAQNALLAELAKQVKFEVGNHFINGEYAESGDDKLFNGIVYRMEHAEDKIVVSTSANTIIGRLKALKSAIPVWMRSNPNLCIIMSVTDFDTYDEELTEREHKGADYTDMNPERFKGIAIKPLADWPDGLIVATIASMDYDSNLWAGIDFQDDEEVIQIDKLTNAGEKYFFKMLMKADTQIAFDEEVVWLDAREAPEVPVISGDTVIDNLAATAGNTYRTYHTSDGSAILADTDADWLTVSVESGNKVKLVRTAYAYAAEGDNPRVATVILTIPETEATLEVTVKQVMASE